CVASVPAGEGPSHQSRSGRRRPRAGRRLAPVHPRIPAGETQRQIVHRYECDESLAMTVFDQIKRNAVPAQVMRSAAKGALSVEAQEMLEILVYLTRNPLFAQDAKMTLAQWDAVSAVEILADPAAPPEVLGYFWAEDNRRPVLMPALIENPAISE